MTSKRKTIGFALTNRDNDIIEWLNMLQANDMNPATWVQAILLSELAGQSIDAGGVYTAPAKKKAGAMLFGDDTVTESKSISYGWNVRGSDGVYKPGSVFVLVSSRPIMDYVIDKFVNSRRMKSRYLRAILRKHIRKLKQAPNEPPINQNIEDIFVLYEEYFPDFNPAKYVSGERLSVTRRTDKEERVAPEFESTSFQSEYPVTSPLTASSIESSPSSPVPEAPKKNPLLSHIF